MGVNTKISIFLLYNCKLNSTYKQFHAYHTMKFVLTTLGSSSAQHIILAKNVQHTIITFTILFDLGNNLIGVNTKISIFLQLFI